MKRILFLSGKGGTGKTSVAGAFATLFRNKLLVDCDVDAANLHLLLTPSILDEGTFSGSSEAIKDNEKCTSCGNCLGVCRFRAIDEDYNIDPLMCEGCGACVYACPADAISLVPRESGRWYIADTRLGKLASAELFPGEEASGKLVMLVKEKASTLAKKEQASFLLIDGSPGIGCPVIASISGVDYVILVTEPTLSGLHDLKRTLGVVDHFGIKAFVIINKADLNEDVAHKIEQFSIQHEVAILGRIPYDRKVTEAMLVGKSVVEHEEGIAATAMHRVFKRFAATIK